MWARHRVLTHCGCDSLARLALEVKQAGRSSTRSLEAQHAGNPPACQQTNRSQASRKTAASQPCSPCEGLTSCESKQSVQARQGTHCGLAGPLLRLSTGSWQGTALAGERQGTHCQAAPTPHRDNPGVVQRLIASLVSGAHAHKRHGNEHASGLFITVFAVARAIGLTGYLHSPPQPRASLLPGAEHMIQPVALFGRKGTSSKLCSSSVKAPSHNFSFAIAARSK